MNGDVAIVEMLLAAGASVDHANNGDTPLYVAAFRGHLDVVRALLNAGADTRETLGRGRVCWGGNEQHKDAIVALLRGEPEAGVTDL